MRITKVDIPKYEDNRDGLEDIKMDRLGNIVLIAGKNGAGKTRILNKIFDTLYAKPTNSALISAKQQYEQNNVSIKNWEKGINNHKQQLIEATQQSQIDEYNKTIKLYETYMKSVNEQNVQYENQLNWDLIETSEVSDRYTSVRFVPKRLDLQDCNSFPKNEIIRHATNISMVGIDNLIHGTFAKIQVVQDRCFNATHPDSHISEEEKLLAKNDYDKLQHVIESFLDTKIERTIDGEATLFGFPMGKSNLSDGQKILLQFCLAIYSQETELKDLILILDEPENHLHPSVIIEIIKRIQACVSNGQIWIATHSIPLLAHFDPSSIWYVENSKISYGGKIPEKVLLSLLGNEEGLAKLQDFISLPSQYATSRYAFESLFMPTSLETGIKDPQTSQIRTDLLKLSKNGKLRILDYGVGKGRLISNIFDLDCESQVKLISNIDYIAYDKFPNDKEICESALKKAYGNSDKRYFNDFNSLLSVYDIGSFDVVIMCNVLHEIDPKDWLNLFQDGGVISSLLGENGFLLLVEDHQIPIGEKAYQNGFLVLDTPQLKELFKITEKDNDFTFSDKRGDGRLKAHHIPKRLLIQIDEKSRLDAIRSMSNTSRAKIIEIREKEKNYQNGILHGFWTQQFANSQLILSELTVKAKD